MIWSTVLTLSLNKWSSEQMRTFGDPFFGAEILLNLRFITSNFFYMRSCFSLVLLWFSKFAKLYLTDISSDTYFAISVVVHKTATRVCEANLANFKSVPVIIRKIFSCEKKLQEKDQTDSYFGGVDTFALSNPLCIFQWDVLLPFRQLNDTDPNEIPLQQMQSDDWWIAVLSHQRSVAM